MLTYYLGSFSQTISNRLTLSVNCNCFVKYYELLQTVVGTGRFELPTSRLSVVRSNQLSYAPLAVANYNSISSKKKRYKDGGNWSCTFLRKEVIQPQVPLRLPCYDFTPVADPTVAGSLQKVRIPSSGKTNSHGVTGGVYKARERIHRGVLIHDY